MLAPVIKERVAVPVMPAVPVLPGGPHEDRAVLEQAMDDQPMELAEEERARGFANPNRPDEETVERHNLTHLPAAAWCDICVRSRGRDAPHREAAAAKIDAVRPVIEMDYAEQGKSNQPHDNVKALVAIDRSSGAIYASGVMQKGDDGGYVTSGLLHWDTQRSLFTQTKNLLFAGFETRHRPTCHPSKNNPQQAISQRVKRHNLWPDGVTNERS